MHSEVLQKADGESRLRLRDSGGEEISEYELFESILSKGALTQIDTSLMDAVRVRDNKWDGG